MEIGFYIMVGIYYLILPILEEFFD